MCSSTKACYLDFSNFRTEIQDAISKLSPEYRESITTSTKEHTQTKQLRKVSKRIFRLFISKESRKPIYKITDASAFNANILKCCDILQSSIRLTVVEVNPQKPPTTISGKVFQKAELPTLFHFQIERCNVGSISGRLCAKAIVVERGADSATTVVHSTKEVRKRPSPTPRNNDSSSLPPKSKKAKLGEKTRSSSPIPCTSQSVCRDSVDQSQMSTYEEQEPEIISSEFDFEDSFDESNSDDAENRNSDTEKEKENNLLVRFHQKQKPTIQKYGFFIAGDKNDTEHNVTECTVRFLFFVQSHKKEGQGTTKKDLAQMKIDWETAIRDADKAMQGLYKMASCFSKNKLNKLTGKLDVACTMCPAHCAAAYVKLAVQPVGRPPMLKTVLKANKRCRAKGKSKIVAAPLSATASCKTIGQACPNPKRDTGTKKGKNNLKSSHK